MFKKKPNIKPLAPLRSSDRRRTADQIISDLGISLPPKNDTDPEAKAAATGAQTALRNALLPDNAQSARFTTTQGPDLKQVSGTIYVGAHENGDQRILWARINDKLYPTVYTLWKNPGILPLLHTPSFVVQKLQSGADLMTPGLAFGPPFPEQAVKGAVVAIASIESPSVPIAIGVCEIDVSKLESVRGAKGHAVRTVHWYEDEAWSWSPTGKAGAPPPESMAGWSLGGDLVADDMEDLRIEEDGGVPLSNGPESTGPPQGDTTAPQADDVAGEEPTAEPEKELTTKEIDKAFWDAFLFGVHHYKQTNSGQHNFGLSFPLSQSFVMSHLVQPFLPAFTPAQSNALQVKKTSWKNIKKFIKALDKAMIVKAKDRDGNEVVILDIDFDDREVLEFKPYRLPKKETAGGASAGRGEKANAMADSNDPSIGQKLRKVELYRPKEKLADFFKGSNGTKQLYTSQELRQIVASYFEEEGLVSQTNKRLINLDPFLSNAVFDSNSGLDKEAVAKGSVPRDSLVDRVVKACSPFWAILRNDETTDSAASKPKAGVAPKIQIIHETRSGNKTVTKVSGVEAYFVPPQRLADELRKTCAGSTSVDRLMGSSPKTPVMEILIQGPQKDAVQKALEKRGVNRTWIEFTDKTKGKKK